ncbi:MAG TPA: bL21 family ribosomal protein [Coriobacteriia bacterium]|nr:bL21 family ribosomal protein [Coriobacteriia bacterium]
MVEQTKGPKLTVFQYRNKTGYRRKTGHRQPLTRIRVDEISA